MSILIEDRAGLFALRGLLCEPRAVKRRYIGKLHIPMKRIILQSLIAVILLLSSCQSSDIFKELPGPVSNFISMYWPNPAIESYSHPSADVYRVIIKNGATLEFDSDYLWTDIDGNGMPLPEVLLFDVLPEKLYDYISASQKVNEVFTIKRTPRIYSLTLLDTDIDYDIATETVTQH